MQHYLMDQVQYLPILFRHVCVEVFSVVYCGVITCCDVVVCFPLSLPQSPKAFLESYQDMLLYTQREETWPITKMELEGRGVMEYHD